MYPRIKFARFLLQLGSFIRFLPVLIMRPDDLLEFSRQKYAESHDIESWAEEAFVDSGLRSDELDLLMASREPPGNLLLLGLGGGRDAIALAKMGFRVTGVDYIPALVDWAKRNAARHGITIEGLVQEISRIDVPSEAYDVVWLTTEMYSCVPTRVRRVEMVRRVARSLKPGGFFLFQFHRYTQPRISKRGINLHRLIATFTMGNMGYQEGDMLWGNAEFIHAFLSQEELSSELEDGGLSVVQIQMDALSARGGVICKKI